MRWLQIGSIAAFLMGAIVCAAVAQPGDWLPPIPKDRGQPGDKPAVPMSESPKPKEPPDPTVPSPDLKRAMEKNSKTTATTKLPLVSFRGRVIVKDRPPVAILEVDGKLYFVSKNSVVTSPGNMTLRVTDLTRSELKIEVSPLNEIITLR